MVSGDDCPVEYGIWNMEYGVCSVEVSKITKFPKFPNPKLPTSSLPPANYRYLSYLRRYLR